MTAPEAAPTTPRSRGLALLARTEYRPVETAEERDAVYRLRYRAYTHAGLMEPNGSGRVSDRYDDAPNAWILAVHVDGELCGSVRIHLLTAGERGCNTTDLYGEVLHPRLDGGEVLIDAARLVADPEATRRHPDLGMLLVRMPYVACEHFGADVGLAMVRDDHAPFYRRFFGHEVLAGPRPFPGWTTRKQVLMASDFRSVRDRVAARFPAMASTAAERRRLFGPDVRRAAAAE